MSLAFKTEDTIMKSKIIFTSFLVLMTLTSMNTYSKGNENQKQNTLIWRLASEATKVDSLNTNTIVIDSSQIANLKSVLPNIIFTESDSMLSAKVDSLNSCLSEFQEKIETGEFFLDKLWAQVMLVIIAILAVISIRLLLLAYRLRKEIIQQSERIDRRKKSIEDLEKKIISNSWNSGNKTANTIGVETNKAFQVDITRRVEKLEREKITSSRIISIPNTSKQPPSKPLEKQTLLYADSIIDGKFSHVWEKENEDTIFVLKLENEATASITLSERAHKKILANASYLEGCEKQMIGSTSVETVREGIAQKSSNGKWYVKLPLKVDIK